MWTEVATLISDKINFKNKKIIRDKKGNFIMIMMKEQFHQENIYIPSKRDPKYTKQKLTELKRQEDNSIKIVEKFKTHFQWWIWQPGRRSTREGKDSSNMFIRSHISVKYGKIIYSRSLSLHTPTSLLLHLLPCQVTMEWLWESLGFGAIFGNLRKSRI